MPRFRSLPVVLLLINLLTALAGCATLPQSEPEWPQPKIAYQEFRLDNGLRLIVHEDRSTPIVAVNVWYHVGSKNEPRGRSGFAHLFEHLMFNGSENYDDEFFRPLEAVGATGMNGTTNVDRTNYFGNVPTTALDRLLWLESDRMGHLLGAITQDKLDEQRGVVKNEKRQRENEPYGRVWSLLPKLAYPADHPYSWSTIGSMEDLDAATLDDVKDWFRQWYGAANATLVIAGDVDADTALAKVKHYFGGIPAGPTLARPTRWEAPLSAPVRAKLHDRVPQARLYRVYNVAANFTAEAIELQLAAEILGGGKSSRLYERLVFEEELATQVAAFLSPAELGSQLMFMLTAREGVELAQLEAALDEEIEEFRRQGPNAEELGRVRSALYASVVRGLERVGGHGGKSDQLAAAAVIGGDPALWSKELEWLRDAKTGGVRKTFSRWTDYAPLNLSVLPEGETRAGADEVDRSKLPEVAEAPALEFPSWEEQTLANGLRVVVARRPNSPVTEYRYFAPGGFAADPRGQEGIGTLMMDLRDEAAGGRDALELARTLERNGAHLSAAASLDHFHVSLSTVRGLEAEPLQLFSDVLLDAEYRPADFARRRALLEARIAQERASPFSLGLRALPPLLFGAEHPYGRALTGSGRPETLSNIDLDAIRAHARGFIRPERGTLLIVGDLDLQAAVASLPPALRQWQATGTATALPKLSEVAGVQKPEIYLLHKADAQQSVILAGELVPDLGLASNLDLETANSLFGGLFTSRLNMNLREDKGWAYGAGSAIVTTAAQRPWVIYTRVESERTAASMREINWELNRLLQRNSIRADELSHATRNRALKLPGQHETTGQLAGSIGRILQRQLPADYYATLPQRLQALQPSSVTAAALDHLDSQGLRWVIVGDLGKIQSQIEKLGWASVVVLDDAP